MVEPPPGEAPGAAHPRAWWLFLAGGGVLVLAHGLAAGAAPALVLDLGHVAAGLAGVVAVLVGVRLHRPERRGAWYALAAGQACWTLGAVTGAFVPQQTYPTAADVGHLLGYPLLALGLFLLTRGRRPRRDLEGALDGLTVAASLFLLCWVLVAAPTAARYRESPLAAVVSAAYPLLDIGLVTMLVALLVTPGARTASLRWLVCAVSLVTVVDTTITALGMLARDGMRSFDVVRMVAAVLVGVAALHPSVRALSRPAPAEELRITRGRRVATALAVLVAPGTLAAAQVLGLRLDAWHVVVGAVVLSLLVVARMDVTVRQLMAASAHRDRAQRELAHQAAHDALTGLPNRGQVHRLVAAALGRGQRGGTAVGVLFVDLDGFKTVNDTFGHQAGDEVLREVGRRMGQVLRAGDLVGRLGGDEFVVVLEPVLEESTAVLVGERLVAEVARPIPLEGGQVTHIGASVGVAVSLDGGLDPDLLLSEADAAAYRAKRRGRGRVEVFDAALRRELRNRTELEDALREALTRDQLRLRYQPLVALTSGVTVGHEAVLTWERLGVPRIPDLRAVVETSDLIFDLDAWALQEAAREVAAWGREGWPGLQVGVRVSLRHAARARLGADVAAALTASGLEPHQLVVQVSDRGLVDDPVALGHLEELRRSGTVVSLDDFGLGYSSLRRVPTLPVDAVKLDRMFLEPGSSLREHMLPLIVQGAQRSGLRTVAKGLDSEELRQLARDVGCELGQGEAVGPFVEAAEVLPLLRREQEPTLDHQ